MKIFVWSAAILFLGAFTNSCESNNENKLTDLTSDSLLESQTAMKALDLMQSKCFACHGSDGHLENRIAPPMIAIKKHYKNEHTTLEQFTNDIKSFVNNPTEENVKMTGAFKRFGLMPKMNFPEEELNLISAYLYHNEIKEPAWFKEHYKKEQSNKSATEEPAILTPLENGLQLALKAKKILGKNLMGAINKQGSTYAVEFCNLKANYLIDSMSNALNAHIKRVSDKPRNANAQANAKEAVIIQQFKNTLKEGKAITGVLAETENSKIGYYPILTNQMCLQCHGVPNTQIEDKTLRKINTLYPTDKAVGYGINELRGIWVVEMAQ
ncbi:cytochrome c family protein [Putridiphycobacter roseus]|uniref:Cytochrome c family protein n=1 Tax=Putridiphycobacter roseus TaxID=2219161 RepID=A0A2W1NI49_9FLAO|nr:DUF3365 domain-containing protein [Putridiphycobacter roseus]PZE17606.1 cytochrome c family protein [Putridiphycobacter roseus]